MKTLKFICSVTLAALVFVSCQQEERYSTVKLNLTDAPGDFEEVNIDLKQVQIQFADDSSGWQNMATEGGIYDLLKLQNGVDTLIATGTYPQNVVHQMRLILGNNNNIVVDGKTYPLTVPSGAETGLKIKVHKNLNQTLEELTVDFDAGLSVHQTGAGEYILRPVLKMN